MTRGMLVGAAGRAEESDSLVSSGNTAGSGAQVQPLPPRRARDLRRKEMAPASSSHAAPIEPPVDGVLHEQPAAGSSPLAPGAGLVSGAEVGSGLGSPWS